VGLLRSSAALSAALASVVTAAACGYDEGKDLPAVVEQAAPRAAELVGECGGTSGFIESPSHSCTYLAPGQTFGVTREVAGALARQGFAVSCRGGDETVEIAGLRGNVRAHAEITAGGSVSDAGGDVINVHSPGFEPAGAKAIPARSVAVKLTASRQSEASANFWRAWIAAGVACSEDGLRQQTLTGCLEEWNGSSNEANRRLAVRRLRARVAYVVVSSEKAGVSSGCFFGFLARRGRYLIFKSSWRQGDLVFAEPELGYASGKGLDADARVGRDGKLELKPPTLNERCETWWSAPAGYELRHETASRRLAGEIQAVHTAGANPHCLYTLRRRGKYLRAIIEFDQARWAWKSFRPLHLEGAFQPNGQLRADGNLSVGP
jgi:hypothetical protein